MKIKKYQNTNGPITRNVAASDMTALVSSQPQLWLKQDTEERALNTTRMRSTDEQERERGKKAEKQRRKRKIVERSQVSDPHHDHSTEQPDNLAEAIINQGVEQDAEKHNPYGWYRRSFDRTSPMYQGAITGLSKDEAEDRMGFFANLGDAWGTTNARNDSSQPIWKRMTDRMLWNLDSRNPRSSETYATISAPLMLQGMPLLTNTGATTGMMLAGLVGEAVNYSPYLLSGNTFGDYLGKLPIVTNAAGNTIVPFVTAFHPSMGRMINYANKRGTWYAPFEYTTAHSKIGKRGISMALNTTDIYDPILPIKIGIRESDSQRKIAWLKYLLTGKPSTKKIKISENSPVITDPTAGEGYYASFNNDNNMEGGLLGSLLGGNGTKFTSVKLTPKRRLIEGTDLEPELFTRVGTGDEHGVLEKYTHETNPLYKNAVVYETNHAPTEVAPEGNIRSLGTLKGDISGDIRLYNKKGLQRGWYNASGHQIEVGIDANGNPVARSWDIYKFNPKDFKLRWFDRHGAKYSKLVDFGINTVEEATKDNVFIVRTPWYLRDGRWLYDSTKL